MALCNVFFVCGGVFPLSGGSIVKGDSVIPVLVGICIYYFRN
jgi:hypothetical protein